MIQRTIQHLSDRLTYFSYFNAWIFMGILSVSLKSHPWHRRMPAFEKFYIRYKDDTMVSLYIRIFTFMLMWVIIFLIAMLLFF
jgi:hypothetical protein